MECSPSKFDGSSSGESCDEDEGGLGDRHHRRPKNVSNFFVNDEQCNNEMRASSSTGQFSRKGKEKPKNSNLNTKIGSGGFSLSLNKTQIDAE